MATSAPASSTATRITTITNTMKAIHARKPPPRQLCGAKPIEWTTPSSPSTCSRTLPGSAARCSGSVTSVSTMT